MIHGQGRRHKCRIDFVPGKGKAQGLPVDKKINYKDLRWLKVYTNQGDLSKFFFFFRVLALGTIQEFSICSMRF
jgi:hypothetical protein